MRVEPLSFGASTMSLRLQGWFRIALERRSSTTEGLEHAQELKPLRGSRRSRVDASAHGQDRRRRHDAKRSHAMCGRASRHAEHEHAATHTDRTLTDAAKEAETKAAPEFAHAMASRRLRSRRHASQVAAGGARRSLARTKSFVRAALGRFHSGLPEESRRRLRLQGRSRNA